jgi:hypothetical protein
MRRRSRAAPTFAETALCAENTAELIIGQHHASGNFHHEALARCPRHAADHRLASDCVRVGAYA